MVLTHGHGDHAGGTHQFEKFYVHKNDVKMALSANLESRRNYAKSILDTYPESREFFDPADMTVENPHPEALPFTDGKIFDLGDTVAYEVMVPRVDMTAVEGDSTLKEVISVMRETGYSRLPVYRGTVDRIVGIAHIKDLLEPILDQRSETHEISRYMRQASYVPDTKDIIPLLSEIQTSHEQMVIVVDEYGGTAGIITIEDIIEEVVGEIEDEFDPDNKYLTQISEREWMVDGRFSTDDAIELGWPVEDTEEYETIAGFVLELADRLPRPGDVFEHEGWQFRVQSMRGRRVSMLRVIAPEPAHDDEEDGHSSTMD